MRHTQHLVSCAFAALSIVAVTVSVKEGLNQIRSKLQNVGSMADSELVFAIRLSGFQSGNKLVAGYNYDLLKQFAAHLDSDAYIHYDFSGEDYLDSLLRGSVDLVVLPAHDTVSMSDSLFFYAPAGNSTVWGIRYDRPKAAREITEWVESRMESGRHHIDSTIYMNLPDPHQAASEGITVSRLSPYDGLIKEGAKRLGWDWRLLAALVHEESHFHIEAHSRKGARGLMQMMPGTAEYFGADNLLDPEENLEAGVLLLERLQELFKEYAGKKDGYKFILAAYNAGAARLREFISTAEEDGIGSDTWEDVESSIPQFKETVIFVKNVTDTYKDYQVICPDKR